MLKPSTYLRGTVQAKLPSLAQWFNDYPVSNELTQFIARSRQQIASIMQGLDSRLLVVVGPCSIHDITAAKDYAERLSEINKKYQKQLLIVMRSYFEKPRTRTGWTGLIYDPYLDNSYDIVAGISQARELLLNINRLEIPVATEFLDVTTYHYIADLISWGAIGARTTESQLHRQMASALPCPIGFKNSTDGSIQVAIDAIYAARGSHILVTPGWQGGLQTLKTQGNQHGHIILRGGTRPNYFPDDVSEVAMLLNNAQLASNIMIDCSHGNSEKIYQRQMSVVESICQQIEEGPSKIMGVMLESFLIPGKQNIDKGKNLVYGQSITDGCIGWQDTLVALENLARAVSFANARTNRLASAV